MDTMGLTGYMSTIMDDALKQARFFDHEFIMPEHLLLALLRMYTFNEALMAEGVDSLKMHEELVTWLSTQERVPTTVKYVPEPSSLFKTMFGTACALAVSAGRKSVNVPHFVQAIFSLQNSEAAYLLCKSLGDRQGHFMAKINDNFSLENGDADYMDMADDGYDDEDYYDEEMRQPQDWHMLVTDISANVDKRG